MSRSVPAAPPDTLPDRVLVVATPSNALDLLRLAVLRSDDVLFVAETIPAAAGRFALHFAIEVAQRSFAPGDLSDAGLVLVSLDDREDENRIVRAARRHGVPVHVLDRPLVSDFSVLTMLQRPHLMQSAA